ncbi:MAG: DUF502 domain-containing protein [Candidatus Omnitrophota bacterium]
MKKVWNKFLVNFFNGIVLLLPVAVTVAIVKWLVVKLNVIVLEPIARLFTAVTGKTGHVFLAKMLVFIVAIFVVAVIGWGAKIIFINRIFSLGEKIWLKVPVLGRVYHAFKQIFSSLFGHGKTIFRQVVLVEYPRKGLFSLGFATGVAKGEIKDNIKQNGVNVFIPTTPNPTSGIFLIVPEDDVRFLKMSVEDGMKMVISGGAVYSGNNGDNT